MLNKAAMIEEICTMLEIPYQSSLYNCNYKTIEVLHTRLEEIEKGLQKLKHMLYKD